MPEIDYTLRPIGFVRSPLQRRDQVPRQGGEDAPDAQVELDPRFSDALLGLSPGDQIILITWLHAGRRHTLQVHPRGDTTRALAGVFATRSPDRPNPLGLHRVTLRHVDGPRLTVGPLEAIDGTPVLDIKPVLPHSPDA